MAASELGRTGGGALDESGFGSQIEGFEKARLNLCRERVDFVEAQVRRTDAIAQLALAGWGLDNGKESVGDVLGISGSGGEGAVYFGGDLIGGTVGVGAGGVGSEHDVAEDGGLVRAGLNEGGLNSLPRQFVVIGFGQGF